MARTRPPDSVTFVPRVTLSLLVAAAVFVVITGIYLLPVLLEPPPPGAIPDYMAERVRARLDGKVLWLATASLAVVTIMGFAGWLPGMQRRP